MAQQFTFVANSTMRMSSAALARMRAHEKAIYRYVDDGGPGRENCTWGMGTPAHRGPCTANALKTPVSASEVENQSAAGVARAEAAVRRKVSNMVLTQDQFDALVSFTHNVGIGRAQDTLRCVDSGDFKAAAIGISASVYMTIRSPAGLKKIVARGLIRRRAEESAPFREAQS